jgi:hypothetical protein
MRSKKSRASGLAAEDAKEYFEPVGNHLCGGGAWPRFGETSRLRRDLYLACRCGDRRGPSFRNLSVEIVRRDAALKTLCIM